MAMGTSEAVLQVSSRAASCDFGSEPCFSKSDLMSPFRSHIKSIKKRGSRFGLKCLCMIRSHSPSHQLHVIGGGFCGNTSIHQLRLQICKCQNSDGLSGIAAEAGNGTWFVDNAKQLNPMNVAMGTQNVLEFQDVQELKPETNGSISNGTIGTARDTFAKVRVNSLEDEAWDLLRESIVYYCGSPIGTIAAKDPTSSNVLNYDQVFIRDFIPSGIAFLLKGEYDIVRSFILHTLQLQVI